MRRANDEEFPMKTRPRNIAMLAGVLVLAQFAAATAQDKPSPPPSQKPTPLRVQVVISRFQGEKKIATAPYTLAVSASPSRELAQLRIGAELPIETRPTAPSADGKTPPAPSIQYRPVGTNIDCTVRAADEGSFEVRLTIEQSSVLDDAQQQKLQTPRNAPALRSFRFMNSAILRDGQTTQFTNAADALTGEVVRVDVTLNVVK
jgi:hypothetical protein